MGGVQLKECGLGMIKSEKAPEAMRTSSLLKGPSNSSHPMRWTKSPGEKAWGPRAPVSFTCPRKPSLRPTHSIPWGSVCQWQWQLAFLTLSESLILGGHQADPPGTLQWSLWRSHAKHYPSAECLLQAFSVVSTSTLTSGLMLMT